MASTRELWVILRGRDEASRMVHSFARNVRDASNAVRAAQLQSQAAAVRQQAQLLRTNGAIAQQVRAINNHVIGLDKQAKALTLSAAQAREYRDTVLRANGATNQQVAAINDSIRTFERRAAVLRSEAAVARNSMAAMTAGLDDQVRALNTHAAALDTEARRLRDADRAAANHARTLRHLSVGFQQTSDVALGFTFALGAAAAAGGIFIAKAVQATVAYEKQVRLTATQVDKFAGNLEELGDVGIRVANQIGVEFQQIQPALFDIFSSMEVGVKDAEKLLKAFAKGAVAGQVEIQDVSRATIGLMNAFNRPVSDVNKLLDIQFQLVQEGIGTYEEWNQRIGLVTPSAVRAGQSVEMMAAALASATRMGLSAARSGTSVARAMDAMSHPKAVKNMEQLGIKVRDARGKFLPMNQVLRDFRTVLNKMPEKDRVAAILDVFKGAGGTIEARRFLQNMLLGKKNIELFDQVLGEMQNTSGSMEKAYGTMADSVSTKTELLRNKWEILKIGVGEALVPSVLRLVDALSRALDWFNKLPDSTKNIVTQFLLWGTAGAAVGAVLFGLVAIIGFVAAALTTAGGTILIVLGVLALLTAGIVGFGAAILAAYKESEEFRGLLSQLEVVFIRLKDIIVEFATNVWESFNTNVLPPLKEFWRIVSEEVIPVVNATTKQFSEELIPKIEEAARIVEDTLGGAFRIVGNLIKNELNPALQDLTKWWNENRTELMPLITALGQLAKAMIILIGLIGATGLVSALSSAIIAFKMFSSQLKVTGDMIQLGILWIRGLWSQFQTLIGWVGRAGQKFNEFKILVPGALKIVVDSIKRTFSNAGTWLYNAGQQIINGLIQGIKDRVPGLDDILGWVAQKVRDYWPFSPAKTGPLSGRGSLFYAGQNLMKDLGKGIMREATGLQRISGSITGMVTNPLLPPAGSIGYDSFGTPPPDSIGSESGGKTIHNEFNITTQEIDPRKHAADLGWELMGRM